MGQAEALKRGDIGSFLRGVRASGESSFMYLQNVYTTKNVREQELSLALAVTDYALSGTERTSAWRVHGGGFAGTVQAFVPDENVDGYKSGMEAVFGAGSCAVLKVRPRGLHGGSLSVSCTSNSVHAVSFGSLKNVSLDLTSGMNMVEGRNESGKSTFGDLIRFIFYGFSGKADRENHLSFSTGIAEGSAIINCGGKRYRIERRCVGAKDSLSVIDLDDGSSCFAGKVPGEVFFRLPAKLFTSTVFVGQTAGRRIDGRETSEAVENLLFSADESVSAKKSLQILDKGRVSLLHKNGKGGRLYTVDGEIGELKEDFEAASRSNGEMISLRGSTAELSERLETEQRQSETINKNLAGHRMLEIRARRKRLEDAERDYQEIVAEADAFRKENTRNGFFPDREYARQLEECAGAIANAEAREKKRIAC